MYEKKVVNSDSQQLHKYQQNKHSPLTPQTTVCTHTHKNITTYGIRNPGPSLGQMQKGGRVR